MPSPAPSRVAVAIAAEVHAFCAAQADPAQAAKYARFFVEGYDAWGVSDKHPQWGANRKAWVERLRVAGPEAFLDAGDRLVRTGKYEEVSFAILFAADLADLYTPAAFERIERWFAPAPRGGFGIRNWAHCDVLCSEVLSPFLLRGIVPLARLEPWRASEHKFQRRAVPVALCTPLNSRRTFLDSTRDYRALLRLIEPLLGDGERVVHQGVGWFLRDAWKRRPEEIEAFLARHKETAPRLIVQYATEKMTPEARARFRRTKGAAKGRGPATARSRGRGSGAARTRRR